ncbi:Glycosyltransferase [Rhynchospora pubera]|nr:Glycosyltransferase [Rhynchospora pubera]
MIPWPLYAEQHLNAFMLVNEMHVAVKLEADRKNKGFVSAVDLEQAIKLLMDPGSEERSRIRVQVEEMMSACRKAVQRGGVSFVHLQKLAGELGKV